MTRHRGYRYARWAALVVICGVIAAVGYERGLPFGSREERQVLLDPDRIVVLRTPGGFLEVSTLVKVEDFRWRSSYTCIWSDCGQLLGERIGRVRLPVHYTYRIPLAETWTLTLDGEHYVLAIPAPTPLLPPGVDLEHAEFSSERGGLLAPSTAANQEILLKNLGPELSRRAQRAEYLRQQMPAAEKTVKEFAEKWMRTQTRGPVRPVRVEFRTAESG